MNTSQSTFARVGAGLFSSVLGAVLLLMVGGLLVADRALTSASVQQARIDGTESAHVLEQVIARQVEGLSVFSALFLGASVRDSEFTMLAGDFAGRRAGLLEVWITDSLGRERHRAAPAGRSSRLTDSLLAHASAASSPRVIARGGSSPEIAVTRPIRVGGVLRGTAGASFEPAGLFAPVMEDTSRTRSLLLTAGADTLLRSHLGNVSRRSLPDGRDVRLPGTVWRLRVAHAEASQGLRITLWALGLIAVAFLGGGVLRERRQALRVAERSAELERLSSELLRANRMKSEFLANVSHELRTPLNAIVGFVDLLRDGVYGDLSNRQTPPVERIAASATHLRHLVDQVLDIAKIAAGRLEVHAETIVLRPFVLNVASELEPLITERGLNLSIAVAASLPKVRTDPTHLRQILVNLIGNAIKYTPAGGIAVRARLAGGPTMTNGRRVTSEDPMLLSRSPDRRRIWIALQVIDTGIGIAAPDLERIFDEFEQVNAGPRGDSMERGTGLGLAISRRLARLLGGDISVESQPGKGSTFTIWLPVNAADLAAEPSEAEDAAQATA